jgi:hypothetical protein
MPKIIYLALLLSLLMLGGGPAYGQEPPEDAQEGTPEAEAAPQPEAPKQISTVIIDNNRLSVEFVNVSLGEILRLISQKAGFRLEGSSPAFNKKITTKFNDLDMDTGLVRLFSMVNENNYLISYNTKGAIAELKIPSPGISAKASSSSMGTPGGGRRPPITDYLRRRSRILRRPAAEGDPAQIRRPAPTPPQPEETEEAPEE